MKASIYTEYGPPSVLEIREVEKPVPKENEILVRVHATTVNRTDCAMLRAKPFIMRFFTGLFTPRKPILGTEFAGTVEAVGAAVTSYRVGDNVFGFDDSGVSSHAEYLTLGEDQDFTLMPPNTTFEQAAASLEGAHYGYNFIDKVPLEAGQLVLVNGASGGIGLATVQMLHALGARVVAVCNTKNLELVQSLGAERVIDYTQVDFTKDEERCHYVFDSVGKSSFGKCKSLLRPGGAYISSELGEGAQNVFLALITPLFGNKKVIFPIPSDRKRSIFFIKKLMEEGKFKAVIDRTYPLEKIAEAFDYVEKGLKTGNVVIRLYSDEKDSTIF